MAPSTKAAKSGSGGGARGVPVVATKAKAKTPSPQKQKLTAQTYGQKKPTPLKKRPRQEEPVEEDDNDKQKEEEQEVEEENGHAAAEKDEGDEGEQDDEQDQQNEEEADGEQEEQEEEEEEVPPPKKRAKKASTAQAKQAPKSATKPKANGKNTTSKATKTTPTKPTKPITKKAAVAAASKKKKAKAPSASAARKRKTVEDKISENAPMNEPFFVETGSEWHGTNIDFEELNELRHMWELPAACHILWLLQTPLTLRVCNTLLEYEAALLNPENSTLLEDVFTKLLLKKSERDCLAPGIGLKYEWWNKQLREYYMAMYEQWYALLRKAGEKTPASFLLDSEEEDEDQEGEERDVELSDDEWLALDILKSRLEGLGMECPLKHQSFSDLSVVLRCKILLNLCEAVVDDTRNTDYIRQMEEDDLRVEPLGRDRLGNLFYYYPQFYNERRVYRLENGTTRWQLWAKGEATLQQMLAAMKQIRGRKTRGEQELIDHLEVISEHIGQEAEVRAKEVEKATKKAILEAIPRKRSMRIQVKQIEQLEKKQEDEETKRVLTLEEIAELKRAELLKKVDQEAEREAREKDREARRAAREEAEKEAALADRELRRQKRMEMEKKEEIKAAEAEEARKRQEEARKLRALQRKAAEAAAADDEEQHVVDEQGDTRMSETASPTAANGLADPQVK